MDTMPIGAKRRQGDRTAARRAVVELYVANYAPLMRLARLLVRDPATAEDVVQDAFARLYASWGALRDLDAAPAYLRTTVVNLARGRGRRLAVAARYLPDRVRDARSAEDEALQDDVRAGVIAALQRCSNRQRACLVLRYYEGMTETEIASTVGCSVGSVRTHVKRGLTRLEQILSPTHLEAWQ